jgi:hypothetical protein
VPDKEGAPASWPQPVPRVCSFGTHISGRIGSPNFTAVGTKGFGPWILPATSWGRVRSHQSASLLKHCQAWGQQPCKDANFVLYFASVGP